MDSLYTSNSDIFIVNYNEQSKIFNKDDCKDIINKIKKEDPLFIFVGTQESRSGDDKHFQHALRSELESINYKLLHKIDASITGLIGDKNVRSRIYYNKNTVSFDKEETIKKLINRKNITLSKRKTSIKSIFSIDKKGLDNNFSINNKGNKNIKIEDISTKINSVSALKKIGSNKFYKRSICTKLEFTHYGKPKKFIFINSHLSNTADYNTEFISLISEFSLIDNWENGYNIFFFGYLKINDVENVIQPLSEQSKNNNFYKALLNSIYRRGNNTILYAVSNNNNNEYIKVNDTIDYYIRYKNSYSLVFQFF
jgi:hypothetical protein